MKLPIRSFVMVTAVGAAALVGELAAQQPTFRTGTTLVEVSAVVTRDGRPVTDLRADEITVLDNGQAQPIVAFERVDLARGELPEQRRDFVLVLDDLHVSPASTALAAQAAMSFVDALGPHDRLAVVNTGIGDLRLDLTTDREPARALIRKFRGQRNNTIPFEVELRTRTAMGVLQDVAASLRSDAVQRRAVLLISEGHEGLLQEAPSNLNPAGVAAFDTYRGVLREAALSNVAIYTVDPRGLRAPGGAHTSSRQTAAVDLGQQVQQIRDNELFGSLAILARNTGGLQTLWTNDLTSVFPRMLEDSRQYYRIAYAQPEPAPGKKQPAQRTIKVKVARPGVDVRARERYAPASVS